MNKLLLFVLFNFCVLSLSAQFPGMGGFGKKAPSIKGNISGKLIDSLTNQDVSYATVVLKVEGKDKEINGVLSEDNGKFKLTEVPVGKYKLYLSRIL